MASNKPVKTLRVGVIKAAIWKNEADGKAFYNVTFGRSFKQGDTWKESDSYGFDDLLTVAKLAEMAWGWVLREREREAEAKRE